LRSLTVSFTWGVIDRWLQLGWVEGNADSIIADKVARRKRVGKLARDWNASNKNAAATTQSIRNQHGLVGRAALRLPRQSKIRAV
jgi:hypothetical protein